MNPQGTPEKKTGSGCTFSKLIRPVQRRRVKKVHSAPGFFDVDFPLLSR
jgi:hypothetical protein